MNDGQHAATLRGPRDGPRSAGDDDGDEPASARHYQQCGGCRADLHGLRRVRAGTSTGAHDGEPIIVPIEADLSNLAHLRAERLNQAPTPA